MSSLKMLEDNDQLNSERQWLSPLDYFDQS